MSNCSFRCPLRTRTAQRSDRPSPVLDKYRSSSTFLKIVLCFWSRSEKYWCQLFLSFHDLIERWLVPFKSTDALVLKLCSLCFPLNYSFASSMFLQWRLACSNITSVAYRPYGWWKNLWLFSPKNFILITSATSATKTFYISSHSYKTNQKPFKHGFLTFESSSIELLWPTVFQKNIFMKNWSLDKTSLSSPLLLSKGPSILALIWHQIESRVVEEKFVFCLITAWSLQSTKDENTRQFFSDFVSKSELRSVSTLFGSSS